MIFVRIMLCLVVLLYIAWFVIAYTTPPSFDEAPALIDEAS